MTSSTTHDSPSDASSFFEAGVRAPALVALAIAAVVVGPLARRGWLVLLDWTPGPHLDVSRTIHGLQGSLTATVPLSAAVAAASPVLGAAIGWVPAAIAVGLAVFAMARLVGGPPARWLPAGVLYGFNPVIFERLAAGHFLFLLGYAGLPLAAKAALVGVRRGRVASSTLWLTVLMACAVHYAWIGGVLYAAVAVVAFRERGWRAFRWLGAVTAATALASTYLWLPLLGGGQAFRVTTLDLAAYRTASDRIFGLYSNVAGLYGFWRVGEFRLPKEDLRGWPLLLLAMLLVVAAGLRAGWRVPDQRAAVQSLALAGAVGYVLALGDQGPTGAVFRAAFDHVPGFSIMREPQKFVALVAMVYAVGFGQGVERLVQRASRQATRRLAVAAFAAVPVLYTPTLAFGLAGRIAPVHYPDAWSVADRMIGPGQGRVLFLPWHQYLDLGFTKRRVANPADQVFRREVIVADNVELSGLESGSTDPRSAYLKSLLGQGPNLCAFGDLVAPLGVEFVVLARVVDFGAYRWLGEQADLDLVFDAPELVVYRNLRYRGLGYRTEPTVAPADPSGAVTGGCDPTRDATVNAGVVKVSPVAYRVPAGPAGRLLLAVPFDRSWSLGGRAPVQTTGGSMAFDAPPRGGLAKFGHWKLVRAGYQVSFLVTVLLVLAARRSGRKIGAKRNPED